MIKRILIDIRDFAYHYSKKENGLEYAKTDYLFKVIGFLAFYYIGFTILIVHSAAYFYSARLNEATPLITRFIIGILVFVLPMWFIAKVALKWIRGIPIVTEIDREEYKRKRSVTILVVFVGVIFFLGTIVLPIYFQGGKIHIGDYVIQRE